MIGTIRARHRRCLELEAADGCGSSRPVPPALAWRLSWTPVCGSTEDLLSAALRRHSSGAAGPTAVVAARQRWGRGQASRRWISPAGGVWLSAALPWCERPSAMADPGLAVAEGLARQLERLGVRAELKWPNDLQVGGRKLAGLLPRLLWRGAAVRLARIGVGLNGNNAAPPGAVAVKELLAPARLGTAELTARVLRALDWAVHHADRPEPVRRAAQARLVGLGGVIPWRGESWRVEGLAADGGLMLRRGSVMVVRRRRF
ncbi:biotin--[acetyl-CoA-carboxylase] ligase [Synechococcus sp. RSCCF101]|uniref:biotin--[acetyl-CoA-carboxylase] ligase n=1 Tax=Synechococcus sp. RSCCF101 TaxID=2511069 RepID=UPI001245B8D1|nr:biotin--[acetyl-CoA-carboxylase] ligase [Synechococcus sp. RSCCF101]QEY30930.1 biotin--[acetyl-CoA-carboxylase] ligase [Synechococcus sp. RSCCF101]